MIRRDIEASTNTINTQTDKRASSSYEDTRSSCILFDEVSSYIIVAIDSGAESTLLQSLSVLLYTEKHDE